MTRQVATDQQSGAPWTQIGGDEPMPGQQRVPTVVLHAAQGQVLQPSAGV